MTFSIGRTAYRLHVDYSFNANDQKTRFSLCHSVKERRPVLILIRIRLGEGYTTQKDTHTRVGTGVWRPARTSSQSQFIAKLP